MSHNIGEIFSSSGDMLLKMWSVSVPPGSRALQQHSHIQFEITSVKSGMGEYTVGNQVYPMRPGDIFVFASNEFHCITNVDNNGMEIINIHFEPRYLWGSSFDSLSDEHLNICFSCSSSFQNRIPAENAKPLMEIFNNIFTEMTNEISEYRLMVKSLVNNLLILLIRDYNYTDKNNTVNRDHIKCVRKAILFIDNHIGEKLTLDGISKTAGISPTYFSAIFKKINNITLWNYIFSKRIEKAIRLITEDGNSDTMLEIALQCGFNNTTNFNKIFLRQTGMTPSEYKKHGVNYIS